jgi:hypothetical protein
MKYFTFDEIKCPCCGDYYIDKHFYDRLDEAREKADIPFVITSGCRCEKHNKEVGGKPNSSHLFNRDADLLSKAVDIKVESSRERCIILQALIETGFNRIGIGKDFIHVDYDREKPQCVIWHYYI